MPQRRERDGEVGGEIYPISIQPNNNTLKSVLDIDANYKVDFTTANSIRTVLGFNSQIYSAGYNESENIVNVMNVNSLRATSDVIGSPYYNGTTEQRNNEKRYIFLFPECWSRI